MRSLAFSRSSKPLLLLLRPWDLNIGCPAVALVPCQVSPSVRYRVPWGSNRLPLVQVSGAWRLSYASSFVCTPGRACVERLLTCAWPFQDPSCLWTLLLFVTLGWLGLHRIQRLLREHPTVDGASMVVAVLSCALLGPIFFAQDGFAFADFLHSAEVEIWDPEIEVVQRLRDKLTDETLIAFIEQPGQHLTYIFFLLPFYWLIVTRIADLLNSVDVFSQVVQQLQVASLVIFAIWVLSPSTCLCWCEAADVVLILRHWAFHITAHALRPSLMVKVRAELCWRGNAIALRTPGVPPQRLVVSLSRWAFAPHCCLHFVPSVYTFLEHLQPPGDVLPDSYAQQLQGGDFPLLWWDTWLSVANFLPLRDVPSFVLTGKAFASLSLSQRFWEHRIPPSESAPEAQAPAPESRSLRTQCYMHHCKQSVPIESGILTTGLLPYPITTTIWNLRKDCLTEDTV